MPTRFVRTHNRSFVGARFAFAHPPFGSKGPRLEARTAKPTIIAPAAPPGTTKRLSPHPARALIMLGILAH